MTEVFVDHCSDESEIDTPHQSDADVQDSDRYESLNTIRLYFKQIGKVALLSAEEEAELAKRIEAGVYAERLLADTDAQTELEFEKGFKRHENLTEAERQDLEALAADGEEAKMHLIEANLRFVVSKAKNYVGRGVDMQDLIQEGNLGLMRAIEKFDYTKGFRISTYANDWIRQAITRGMVEQSRTIRIPEHAVDKFIKLDRVKWDMVQELAREPSTADIAEKAKMPVEKVEEYLAFSKNVMSLDILTGDSGKESIGDVVALSDDELLGSDYSEMFEGLDKALDTLSWRERTIMKLRYGIVLHAHEREEILRICGHSYTIEDERPWTYERLSHMFGLTKQRIGQIEKKMLSTLRDGRADHLKVYVS